MGVVAVDFQRTIGLVSYHHHEGLKHVLCLIHHLDSFQHVLCSSNHPNGDSQLESWIKEACHHHEGLKCWLSYDAWAMTQLRGGQIGDLLFVYS